MDRFKCCVKLLLIIPPPTNSFPGSFLLSVTQMDDWNFLHDKELQRHLQSHYKIAQKDKHEGCNGENIHISNNCFYDPAVRQAIFLCMFFSVLLHLILLGSIVLSIVKNYLSQSTGYASSTL